MVFWKKTIYRFLIAVIFSTLNLAYGVDINWSANIRYRLKTDTSEDVNEGVFSSFSETRSRLGLNLVGTKVSGHFIIQDSRIVGAPENSSGITSFTPGVFFYQAYFKLGTDTRYLKFGRFELAFGNQRILAKNNWNNIGRSFEGVLYHTKTPFLKGDVALFSLQIVESYEEEHNDEKDDMLNGVYFRVPLSSMGDKSALEPYALHYQDNDPKQSYNLYGSRLNIERNSFMLEAEVGIQNSSSISANMLSINLGYKPKKEGWFKNIILGTDRVSGDDIGSEKQEGFSKYFGARHKHHGYYDYKFHKKFFGHDHGGLQEINLKSNINFFWKTNVLIAIHNFNNGKGNVHFGNELDVVFKNKFENGVSSEVGLVFYNSSIDEEILPFYYFMITIDM